MISEDLGVIFKVLVKLSQKKQHCGRNNIDHRRPCRTEFTPVSLYSTEIPRYRSRFLEYKLTRVKFVHGRPWWILPISRSQRKSGGCCNVGSLTARFMGPTWAQLGPTGPRWTPCWPHKPCYIGYPSQTHLRFQSCEISLVQYSSSWIVLKIGKRLGSVNTMFCTKFKNDFTAVQWIINERGSTRF